RVRIISMEVKPLRQGQEGLCALSTCGIGHFIEVFHEEGRMRLSQGQVIYDEPFTTTQELSGAAEALLTAPLVIPGELPVESWHYRYLKRALDLTGGLVMLAVFLIPGVLIALAILITSPYPVFYSEERVGRNG